MTAQDGITVVLALVIRNARPLPAIRNEKLPVLIMKRAVVLLLIILKHTVALLLIMKRAVALLLIMKHATPPNHQRNNVSRNE